jgi:hypothetical protein
VYSSPSFAEIGMKSFTSVVAVIALLTTGTFYAQAASSSKNARENQTTAQLNRQQLNMDTQQAATPSQDAAMPAPQAGTTINGKYVPPGARCGNDNPSCAQQIGNPAVNSPSQMRLQHAQ